MPRAKITFNTGKRISGTPDPSVQFVAVAEFLQTKDEVLDDELIEIIIEERAFRHLQKKRQSRKNVLAALRRLLHLPDANQVAALQVVDGDTQSRLWTAQLALSKEVSEPPIYQMTELFDAKTRQTIIQRAIDDLPAINGRPKKLGGDTHFAELLARYWLRKYGARPTVSANSKKLRTVDDDFATFAKDCFERVTGKEAEIDTLLKPLKAAVARLKSDQKIK